jgi:hypothetical protein
MFNTILAQSWERSLLFNPNQEKIYFIPTRINDSQAWILPANFFIRSNEWTIVFELDEVRIYLNMELGSHICLHKKMSGSEMKQFEREWVAFQSSNDETFDLQEFHFLN